MKQLEKQSQDPALWNDRQRAQKLMREVARLRHQVEPWQRLEKELTELKEFVEMAVADGEEEMGLELATQFRRLREEFEELELSTLLSGEYDDGNAILSINPGAGGTDACDWSGMLVRMYRRWAEGKGYEFQVLDLLEHEEAGLKSFTALVKGDYAYGYLKAEKGVHRLVRLSPFDADKQRHTSFASVEVIPEIEEDVQIGIRDDDLKIETFLASSRVGRTSRRTRQRCASPTCRLAS